MHEEALTKESADIFSLFGSFSGFYLVGGTSLALQIGHRRSVDFDFFSYELLPQNLLPKIKRIFVEKSISVTYKAAEQLNLIINDVKVTFFNYPYPNIYPLIDWRTIKLASVPEIALMKAFSIGKRLSFKDYVDWYFLLSEGHVSLADVLDGSKKKFGSDFNDRLFLGQLVSLDEIPSQKIDFLRNEISFGDLQIFFEKEVKKIKL